MNTENRLLKAALWYARNAYYVFPVSADKKPLLFDWPHEATTDGGKIEGWWTKWPDACIGVACGPSQLLFLDLDTYHDDGKSAADRLKTYLQLGEPTFATGRGGEQYIFRCQDQAIKNKAGSLLLQGVILPHIDVRANGGFAIVPPSVSTFGEYKKICGAHFKNPPIVPSALLHVITSSKQFRQGSDGSIIPEGRRHTALTSVAGSLRAKGLDAVKILELLRAKNVTCCLPPLDDREVAEIANDIGAKAILEPLASRSEYDFDPVVNASSVTMRSIDWLYKPFLPKGKLTVLAGLPKDGKSLVAVTIAAALTKGSPLPGETRSNRQPMQVIYMTAEDAFDDTLKPRFVAAGADLDKVGFVNFVSVREAAGKEANEPIYLSNHEMLRKMLENYSPGLIVVDPLHCFFGPNVDFYKASETRPVLSGLAKLAEEFGCSMLLIEHLNKSDRKGAAKILGSVDIAAACRSVLMTARNPSDQSDRYVCLEVATSQVDKVAVQFSTEGFSVSESDGSTIETVRIVWGGIEFVTYDEIMSAAHDDSKTSQAENLLLTLLADGKEVPAKEIYAKSSSRWALNAAKSKLTRCGYTFNTEKKGLQGGWIWTMTAPPTVAVA